MSGLESSGIAVPVPRGWEARASRGGHRESEADGSVAYPYVHLANFPMPSTRAAYGGGVVDLMDAFGAFVALLEFSPESAHAPLFTRPMPGRLETRDFSTAQLQRTIRGQLGVQRFFHAAGRAFCLYAVLGGSIALRDSLLDVNGILAGIRITARPSAL